jgi:hypothetical protein
VWLRRGITTWRLTRGCHVEARSHSRPPVGTWSCHLLLVHVKSYSWRGGVLLNMHDHEQSCCSLPLVSLKQTTSFKLSSKVLSFLGAAQNQHAMHLFCGGSRIYCAASAASKRHAIFNVVDSNAQYTRPSTGASTHQGNIRSTCLTLHRCVVCVALPSSGKP